MNTQQDRMKAAQQARFAKYQNEADVPQADRELLAFLENGWFIVPALIVVFGILIFREEVAAFLGLVQP